MFIVACLPPGMPCSARYSHDSLWYRARVVEIFNNPAGSSLIKVVYVDYGTSETVALERMRALPVELHSVPAQAFVVNLPGIEPVPPSDTVGPLLNGSRWSVASLKVMADLVGGKQFIAAIHVSETILPAAGWCAKCRPFLSCLVKRERTLCVPNR